ncbi:cytochrome P450 [Aspergillus candidus]|uniref:Cytochrome P450 n=1 Tax=Aspergillus candidus TaxID=41067 RepID=A0A2I2FJ67_ASPCN|nr:cytochrome P450 [Aspergillus candidus]PLB40662.1 cytochrome P450 [Aspergillus candidus]
MGFLYWAVPVALLTFLALRRWWSDPLSPIPGPWFTKWTDIVLKSHWLRGNRMKYVHDLHRQYGPVVRVGPGEVDVADLAAVKEVHRIGTSFLKSSWYRDLTRHDIENLFNTSDVKFHSTRRRLLSSPISDAELRKSHPLIDARVQLALQQMERQMDRHGVVDVFQWWIFMATDIIGELSFGDSFRMLEQGRKNQYCRDLESISATEGVRVAFPRIVSLADVIPLPYFHQSAKAGQRMEQYAAESVQRYKQLMAAGENRTEALFTKLFDPDKGGLSDRSIIDEAISFIIAGSDTTANTMTYLVWSVCRDEAIRARLLQELATLPEAFDDHHLRRLVYLGQVINETLRLFSGVPSGLPRVSAQDVTLAGVWIPAGTVITTQAYTLHRDPDVFPAPECFNPTRWEQPTKAMKDAFMAFGGGARTCLGVHLARTEIRLATARFFRVFPQARIDGSMSVSDMDQISYFLLSPRGKRCLVNLW